MGRLSMVLRVTFSTCFAIFFSFLFACQQFPAFAINPSESPGIRKEVTLLLSDYLLNVHDFPFQRPSKSEPVSGSPAIPFDNETEEDFDQDWNPWLVCSPLRDVFHISSETLFFVPITYFLKNRSTVPFFILYHSWKGFIA